MHADTTELSTGQGKIADRQTDGLSALYNSSYTILMDFEHTLNITIIYIEMRTYICSYVVIHKSIIPTSIVKLLIISLTLL